MVGATAVDSVKQDVESIFKSVENFMSGKTNKIVPVTSDGRHRVKEVNRDPRPEFAGSANDRASVATAPFPVGVILSDNLYPLVVGKNVNTGMPFVMNLGQQHALVVARGGSDNYRMLIPFPVVVGAPNSPESSLEDTSHEADYRSPPGIYNSKPPQYRTHQTRYLKKYPLHHDSYEKYYNSYPIQEQDPALYHPKVPKKYAQSYNYNRHQDTARPSPEASRYKSYTSKVHNERLVNTNYKGTQEPHRQSVASHYEGPTNSPVENSRAKDGPGSAIKYDSVRPQITYYVEGPRYPIPLPRPRYVYGRNHHQAFRHHSPEFNSEYKSDHFQFTNPINDRPHGDNLSNLKTYHNRKLPVTYEGVPKDFKPSPYIGNITEENDVTGLQPQSEIIQSYDDDGAGDGEFTEQDYMDSIRDR